MRALKERRRDASRAIRLRALSGLDTLFAHRGPGRDTRVLLECSNSLMAGYVLRAFATIASEAGVKGYITTFPGRGERLMQKAEELGLTWVSDLRAVCTQWTLVLLADHAPLKYAPSVPKLILPHGPGPSRMVRQGSYYYDRGRALWPDGTPVYELMLDTSKYAAERALEWLPEYAGRVRVAGDLVADEIVSQVADGAARSEGVTRVAVMSTWGPHGLVPRHSEWLFSEMIALAAEGSHEFLVTMHQNLWDVRRAGTSQWRDRAHELRSAGIRVVGPDEDWTHLLHTTDVAIADHTSLAALYSVLRKPIVPVTVPRDLLIDRTFTAWLYDNREPVGNAPDLRRALADLTAYDLEGAPVVVDMLGRSSELTAEAIHEVMQRSLNRQPA